jgi:hypothetical protein
MNNVNWHAKLHTKCKGSAGTCQSALGCKMSAIFGAVVTLPYIVGREWVLFVEV